MDGGAVVVRSPVLDDLRAGEVALRGIVLEPHRRAVRQQVQYPGRGPGDIGLCGQDRDVPGQRAGRELVIGVQYLHQ